MKTRIITLSKENKADIKLVGAVHFGTSTYYTRVQELLDSNVTLYEGVKESDEAETLQKNDFNWIETYYTNLEKLLEDKIIFQKKGITYRDNWIHADIRGNVINNEMFNFSSEGKVSKFLQKLVSWEIMLKYKDAFINSVVNMKMDPFSTGIFSLFINTKSLMYLRNMKAFCTAIDYLDEPVINIFYGEQHLKELTKLFKNIGYEVKSIEYLDSNEGYQGV
jgi:hypothetical protein